MSENRLFLYDPESKSAIPMAKGYLCGWYCGGDKEPLAAWFDEPEHAEYTAQLKDGHTRFQLKTEDDLPAGTMVSWSDGKKTWKEGT